MGCLWCKQVVSVAEADIAPIVTRLKNELLPEIAAAVEAVLLQEIAAVEAVLLQEVQKIVKPEVKEGKPSTAPGGPRLVPFSLFVRAEVRARPFRSLPGKSAR